MNNKGLKSKVGASASCSFRINNNRFEFEPGIIKVKNTCICKALATIIMKALGSSVNEAYITFEKPDEQSNTVHIDIWEKDPKNCIESSYHKESTFEDLHDVMKVIESNSPRETLHGFEDSDSKYTVTLKINMELLTIV